MSDMDDDFKEFKKFNQAKRWSNMEKSTKLLIDNCIVFKSFNGGVLLKVGDYDFYPSTGLFVNRGT